MNNTIFRHFYRPLSSYCLMWRCMHILLVMMLAAAPRVNGQQEENLTGSVWNPPVTHVEMTGGIQQISFEIKVDHGYNVTGPSTVETLDVQGNDGSFFAIRFGFWGPGAIVEGNQVHYQGETLQQNTRFFDAEHNPKAANLFQAAGDYAIVFVNIIVDPKAAGPGNRGVMPSTLSVTSVLSSGESFAFQTDVGGDTVVLGKPFEGQQWVSTNGLADVSTAHRRAITPTQPGKMIQRYAIDWIQYGDDHKLFANDGLANEDWYCYGVELLAVADGTVVSVKSDLVDHQPFLAADYALTFETVLGNHVIIDIGGQGERFAMYAHMQFGSALVQPNDTVTKGQVVGKLGNTGSSGAPHLHLHVSRCPDAVTCADLPYVFDEYWTVNYLSLHPLDMAGGGTYLGPAVTAIHGTNALPQNLEVLNFTQPNSGVSDRMGHVSFFAALCSTIYILIY